MMDMEEIILEHMYIREWVDEFVKEALKNKTFSEMQEPKTSIPVSQ